MFFLDRAGSIFGLDGPAICVGDQFVCSDGKNWFNGDSHAGFEDCFVVCVFVIWNDGVFVKGFS